MRTLAVALLLAVDAGLPHRDEPTARPPADHASSDNGRLNQGEVSDGESARSPRCGGRLIHHAAAVAVRALPVAVVETPLETLLVSSPGGLHRPATTGRPAARRAVGMAAITRGADGEEAAAVSAALLA